MIKVFIFRTACLLLACQLILADETKASGPSYYLIGNSLTWDTVPSRLDGDVQWHVDCGKSLPYIYANPEAPCVKTSTLWPEGLNDKQYDFISFQTHYGATLEEDVETISKWMKMQPSAIVIIHTGWAHSASRAEEFAKVRPGGPMTHSKAYVNALLSRLKELHPGRQFRQTYAIDLLAIVAEDIEAGTAPIKNVAELHRDKIHMTISGGRYLMHNAMRQAMGQPISEAGFEKSDPELKAYLRTVIARSPGNAE